MTLQQRQHYLAMWSGPRNISTAMMRAWGSRSDTAVIDEPFYAHYLQHTAQPHPGAEQIIASQASDWRTVVRQISGPIPDNKALFYQKHITTHMLDHIELDWLDSMLHCFLIREPKKVLASYSQQRPGAAATDLGYQQQQRIYEYVRRRPGISPVVIDSDRFLQNPSAQLQQICARLGLEYTGAMLSWQPGIRKTDGLWHRWWYESVANSTGFKPWQDNKVTLTAAQQAIADECEPFYRELYDQALRNTA